MELILHSNSQFQCPCGCVNATAEKTFSAQHPIREVFVLQKLHTKFRFTTQSDLGLLVLLFTDTLVVRSAAGGGGAAGGWSGGRGSTVLEALKQDPFRFYGRVKRRIQPVIATAAL